MVAMQTAQRIALSTAGFYAEPRVCAEGRPFFMIRHETEPLADSRRTLAQCESVASFLGAHSRPVSLAGR
jgi:hypothetical protein